MTEEEQYQEDLRSYKVELIELLHKSQDSFEKQLSYISAGALALSVGFIKDVVPKISTAQGHGLLAIGWILLCLTLLINLISHIRVAGLHNKTIRDLNHKNFNDEIVEKRYKEVDFTNWASVWTLFAGILLIVVFVILNIYAHG